VSICDVGQSPHAILAMMISLLRDSPWALQHDYNSLSQFEDMLLPASLLSAPTSILRTWSGLVVTRVKPFHVQGNPFEATDPVPRRNLAVLRQHARAWLSALCGAFAAMASEERGPLAAAITAYAGVADTETAAQYFRIAIQKLIKVCVHPTPC